MMRGRKFGWNGSSANNTIMLEDFSLLSLVASNYRSRSSRKLLTLIVIYTLAVKVPVHPGSRKPGVCGLYVPLLLPSLCILLYNKISQLAAYYDWSLSVEYSPVVFSFRGIVVTREAPTAVGTNLTCAMLLGRLLVDNSLIKTFPNARECHTLVRAPRRGVPLVPESVENCGGIITPNKCRDAMMLTKPGSFIYGFNSA